MSKLILLVAFLFALPLRAGMYDEKMDKKQAEEIKQEMEEAPTSTPLGGSRSGSLELTDEEKTRRQHELEKERQLYEYEGHYRQGL